MKKQPILTAGAVALVALTIGGTASAATAGTYKSNAKVKFVQDTSITPPVDPTDPGSEVTPVDPDGTNPDPGTAGPLSIDFASSFGFDEQKITTKDEVYNAKAQILSDGTFRPNYLQVTDKRGGANGWTVQVKQDTQFASASGTLDGALISVKNGQVDSISTSTVPSLVNKSFDLTIDEDGAGVSQNIVGAKTGEGAGTWVYRFGDDTNKETSVTLAVPGSTTKYAEEYTTELTWTLADVPHVETQP
ncbi:cell surface protein [Carnobacterium divergens]|uniref:WxL domain-containing protein n=1 Tax=Carnobacterium divergens TaxID=2748 RepID=UPI000D4271DC|nr:WxL domain-containing protein [Carnobacterium divergens]MCO6018754.1 WxL domain-containing protein [Carnobacterium divergens]TFI63923.1 cell surface protein [Carnobacterium divergens]TFI91086.1 cell surface protein [Carnobacterium divergens]TFJ05953.1 cell surface protein [Carnobacterium divergens]TFJ07601.1 cell surface protein [Carnobacterium divergens]